MRNLLVTCAVGCLVSLLHACSAERTPKPESEAADPYIAAANNPLMYFADRLLEGEVEVRLLAPPDTDPAAWSPSVEEVLALQGAELVLLNGAGYEGWLDKVSISSGKLIDTTLGARDQWIGIENQVTHSHGPEGEHAHGDYAFTTWMDFSLARVQAEAVATALQKTWPGRSAAIAAKLDGLLADLQELDSGYGQQSARLAGWKLIYSHPVYQYFERRYGLAGTSLHWEPEVMPGQAQWQQLQQLIGDKAVLFVWEGEPDPAIATRLEAMGLISIVIDPAANRGEADWLQVQQHNLGRLAQLNIPRATRQSEGSNRDGHNE